MQSQKAYAPLRTLPFTEASEHFKTHNSNHLATHFTGLRYVIDPDDPTRREYLLQLNEPGLEITFHHPDLFLTKQLGNDIVLQDRLMGEQFYQIARAMNLSSGYAPEVIFGTYWTDPNNAKHFRIQNPLQSVHMLISIEWNKMPLGTEDGDFLDDMLRDGAVTSWESSQCQETTCYILPMGFQLPYDPKEPRATRQERFAAVANTYRLSCFDELYRIQFIQTPDNQEALFCEATELFNKVAPLCNSESLQGAIPKCDPNDILRAIALTEEVIKALNRHQRKINCPPDKMLFLNPHNPLQILVGSTFNSSRIIEGGVEGAIRLVHALEVKSKAKEVLGPNFRQFEPRVEALYGELAIQDKCVLLKFPRDKFSIDQNPYRTTAFSYSEAGLASFIVFLEKEEQTAREFHKLNAINLERNQNLLQSSHQPQSQD